MFNDKTDIIETLVDGVVVKSYIIKYYNDYKLIKTEYINNNNQIHRDDDLPAIISYTNYESIGCYTKDDRCEIWIKNGKIYRDNDEPSIIVYYGESNNIRFKFWKIGQDIHRNGDKPGVIVFWPNGNVKQEIWYRNNKKHREGDKPAVIEYYRNGKLRKEVWYSNDVIDRKTNKPDDIRYNEDGSVKICFKNTINYTYSKELLEYFLNVYRKNTNPDNVKLINQILGSIRNE